MLSSCDVYTASETLYNQKYTEDNEKIRLIPRVIANYDGTKNKANNLHSSTATQAVSPYSCIISTLQNEESEAIYWNRAFWVEYPDAAIIQARGKIVRKAIVLESAFAGSKGKNIGGRHPVVRLAQCDLPESELADELLEQELRKFGSGSWVDDMPNGYPLKSVFGPNPSIGSFINCVHWFITYVCYVEYDNGEYYYNCVVTDRRCIDWEINFNQPDYGGSSFPDGWQTAWPAEGCPDPSLPCLEGPGGNFQIPQDDNPCLELNPPAYCSNPCDPVDVGGILSQPGIQMKMEELWLSTGYDQYPNSPNMRVEQGAFIYKGLYNDFYSLKPLSSYSNVVKGAGPCHIDFEIDLNMLQSTGVVYFIHTHPARNNENIDCLDGLSRKYKSEIYEDDYETIGKMNTVAEIVGVMIDNEKIIFYNENGPTNVVDRCGF